MLPAVNTIARVQFFERVDELLLELRFPHSILEPLTSGLRMTCRPDPVALIAKSCSSSICTPDEQERFHYQ